MAYLGEPTESDISTLCDVFGIPRDEAISRLKANGNNPENAINEYLDNPHSTKYKWDESQFNTDREGDANAAGISFNIQGADDFSSLSHVNSAAPTRPPSRANNRSPLHRLIDLTDGAAGPVNTAQEDADLARAIAESAAESGIKPQEVGVVDSDMNSKHFGPATRTQYDSNLWAMVPTKTLLGNEDNDPPPSNRKRDIDAPAFLRQTKDHRIGALLSIYSKIPLARNFLLRSGNPALCYGYDDGWWKGSPILRQDVLARQANGEEIWGDDAHPDFIEELHRLMAFLDNTERSYASADTIAETKAIDESFGSWMPDVEDRLFQALLDANIQNPECGIKDMTTIGKIVSVTPSSPAQPQHDDRIKEDDNITEFMFLDIAIDSEGYEWAETLYDLLDHLLWSSAFSLDYTFAHNAKTAVLLKPAEVITIRFGRGGLVKPCEIPAVYYADRYMESRRDLALHFQTQIREIKMDLKNLAWSEEERLNCTGQSCRLQLQGLSHRHDVRDCCAKMIKYAEQLLERQKKDAQWRHFQREWEAGTPYSMDDLHLIHDWSGPLEFTDDEKAKQEKLTCIIQKCQNRIEEANHSLTEYKRKREELTGYLEVVRKRLTCQEDEVDNDLFVFRTNEDAYRPEYWNPSVKYLLRGVATTHELAYVCVRGEGDSSTPTETTVAKDQWWKIGYAKSDASPIKSEKVTLDDVLQAAGTEAKNPILVYASEAALKQERIPLSDPLRMFVKADNRSFQQELAQEASSSEAMNQTKGVQMDDRVTLGVTAENLSQIPLGSAAKRKHRGGSSVATNGSIRSDLADVDLTFDGPETFYGNHEQISKPGDKFDPGMETEELTRQGDGADLGTNTSSGSNMPEMSERRGGANPFLARPGNSAHNPIDLMDLDTESEHVIDG